MKENFVDTKLKHYSSSVKFLDQASQYSQSTLRDYWLWLIRFTCTTLNHLCCWKRVILLLRPYTKTTFHLIRFPLIKVVRACIRMWMYVKVYKWSELINKTTTFILSFNFFNESNPSALSGILLFINYNITLSIFLLMVTTLS